MKVHHLNCATMCPLVGGGYVNEQRRLVCHVLLVETSDGLALVDSGLGEGDVHGRRGAVYTQKLRLMGARLRPEETALRQVLALGHRAEDVRHVVLTHLDFDHAGGIEDFPLAQVHVLAREHEAAMLRAGWNGRSRYRPETWSHAPRWVLHRPDEGEAWFGFAAVRKVAGLPPELLMIPLHGHTPGHAGVAVDTGAGWLLHAGDAYFFHGEMAPSPRCTPGLDLFQRLMAVDDGARRANQARLRDLVRSQPEAVRVFSAHDPTEYERAAAHTKRAAVAG